MANVRVNPNLESELTGSLASGGPLEGTLGEVAEAVALRAQGIARSEYYRHGDYARGIRAEHGLDTDGQLVGRVVAYDWKSHWAEWPPAQERGGRQGRILARAAEQVGLTVVAGSALGTTASSVGRALAGRTRRQLPTRPRRAIAGR